MTEPDPAAPPPDVRQIPAIVEANVQHLHRQLDLNHDEATRAEAQVASLREQRKDLEKRLTLLQQALNVIKPLT